MGIGQLLFGFEGRIGPGKFWLGFLLSAIFLVVCAIGIAHTKSIMHIAIVIVMVVGYVWMRLASYIKRLHDMDTCGAGSLFMFWPFFTNICLFVFSAIVPGTIGPNRFGTDPKNQPAPTAGPRQVSLGYILFSFQGRINRAKYWLIMVIPLILVIVGLLIGGILVAQSMISTAKVQAFCREEAKTGKNYPDCKEMAAFSDVYNKSATSKAKYDSPQAYCESLQKDGKLNGSCDEFLQINQDWLASKYHNQRSDIIPSSADSLMPAAGSSPATTNNAVAANDIDAAHDPKKDLANFAKLAGLGGAAIAGLWFIFAIIAYIPLYWAIFAVTAKRLHDRNLSGWWQAAPFALSILGLVVSLGGPALAVIGGILSLLSLIGSLTLFIICGFIPGTPGNNKFGTDPLQPVGVVA